jgi:hypothetical protein
LLFNMPCTHGTAKSCSSLPLGMIEWMCKHHSLEVWRSFRKSVRHS